MRGGLQTLQSQATENEMVLQELKILTSISDESTTNSGSSAPSAPVVYKLMGPALIRQPIDDALDTVNKRLDFIKSEHGKLSTKIQDHEAKAHIMAKKIQQMQALLQQSTVQAVQAIAAEHQSQQRK